MWTLTVKKQMQTKKGAAKTVLTEGDVTRAWQYHATNRIYNKDPWQNVEAPTAGASQV